MESQELEELIKSTWDACGVQSVRALGRTVFVRTEPPPQRIGLIWLPPKMTQFHGGLPHLRLVVGTVIASGPRAEVKAGDRVCFMRLHFAHWKNIGNDVFVGWIDKNQLIGYYEGAYDNAMAFSRGSASDSGPSSDGTSIERVA